MKKIIFLILLGFIAFQSIDAQRKTFAMGLRIEGNDPNNLGASIRYRIHKPTILEGIVHFYDGFIGASLLYERYKNLSSSGTFDFFYGGGVHLAFGNDVGAGVAGILGFCYTFKDIPVNISLDWKPVLDIIDNTNFRASLFGISIRYTF